MIQGKECSPRPVVEDILEADNPAVDSLEADSLVAADNLVDIRQDG